MCPCMNLDPQELPLGFLLNTIGRLVLEETEAALEGQEIGVVELGILWLISLDPDRPQAEYARYQKRDVTTFGRYVDRLESKGFLRRVPQSNDRRVKALSISPSGLKVLNDGRRKVLDAEARVLSAAPELGAPLKDLLVRLLTKME
jgi:DNA-binding MarR family transcriptional regulator